MYARIYDALDDPNPDAANAALLDLASHIRESGVPVIITDTRGRPTWRATFRSRHRSTTRASRATSPCSIAQNPPLVEPTIGTVHFGDTRLVKSLRIIPALAGGLDRVRFCSPASMRCARADAQIASGCGREWRASPRTSLARRSRASADGSSCWPTARRPIRRPPRGRAHARRPRPARARRAPLRAHRPPARRKHPSMSPSSSDRVTATSGHACRRWRTPWMSSSSWAQGPLVVKGDAVLLEWALEAARQERDRRAGRPWWHTANFGGTHRRR